ncbi:hypothetical protein C7450_11471 [Chelatococcus asaccharovorans]|uniref:Uncharacterized protein n=1 Tax=Chelatococcus asaccharovorans TaxID=28210 RepID=A0A2V3TWT5_9HYPH|nr:hypothetical protein C7450_11471 [Chelatococcus asaccharovorans]
MASDDSISVGFALVSQAALETASRRSKPIVPILVGTQIALFACPLAVPMPSSPVRAAFLVGFVPPLAPTRDCDVLTAEPAYARASIHGASPVSRVRHYTAISSPRLCFAWRYGRAAVLRSNRGVKLAGRRLIRPGSTARMPAKSDCASLLSECRSATDGLARSISSDVDTGSREDNASKQRPRAFPVNRTSPEMLQDQSTFKNCPRDTIVITGLVPEVGCTRFRY